MPHLETGSHILDALCGAPVDAAWARRVLADHPTCTLVAALALRNGLSGTPAPALQPAALRATVVLGAADHQAWADYAGLGGADWYGFYPATDANAPKSTDQVLADFIDQYGHQSAEEDALIERLIFNPVAPDYDLSEYDDGNTYQLGDALYAPAPEQQPQPVAQTSADEPEPVPDTSLMESLAKIFVKQGRYSRAFEIISNLNLKYPEKSVYFADQLRFLQKLMVNQQYQQHSKQ